MPRAEIPDALYDVQARIGYVDAIVDSFADALPAGEAVTGDPALLRSVDRLGSLAGAATLLLRQLRQDAEALEVALLRHD